MSSFMLPIAILIASLLWLAHANLDWKQLSGWVICLITTFFFIEFNNVHSIIRIRTRMVSSCFLLWMGVAYFLHPQQNSTFVLLCMLLSYYTLFHSYQKSQPVRDIFHAFLFIGIGSLFFLPLLYFIPLYYWSMAVYLRSFTFKSFFAGIIGIIAPYWFLAGYALFHNDLNLLISHFHFPTYIEIPSLSVYIGLGIERIFLFCLLGVLNLICMIHFIMTSYNDNIKTRIFFNIITLHSIAILLFLILQPQHFNILFGLLIMNSSPLLSRYFALTSSRLTDILFITTLLLLAAFSTYVLLWK